MQNQNKSVLLKDKDTLLSMHGILYVCILFFLLSLALSDSPYHIISYHIIPYRSFSSGSILLLLFVTCWSLCSTASEKLLSSFPYDCLH
ncbi:hypothetical protein BO79DRAFT_9644 [Aspergillus costaricaensis CBS 115574]|uniref:Uncharacterized protein n=1 Tax=Aspergillus costaricaensis CBS 115574 TaxID=1448317 RepID=A0ACD1IH51_9EURO|nr:hypothetical protein BO79DRAFT_9644 [Aspergillus costaricaensis CBS 115574]RAK89959.1 hypothetical protein BO79DRAFT_9644 [Aspergillus costaricaensis CBS 115574]